MADWDDERIRNNLSDPAKFRQAFPDYSQLDDETIIRNMASAPTPPTVTAETKSEVFGPKPWRPPAANLMPPGTIVNQAAALPTAAPRGPAPSPRLFKESVGEFLSAPPIVPLGRYTRVAAEYHRRHPIAPIFSPSEPTRAALETFSEGVLTDTGKYAEGLTTPPNVVIMVSAMGAPAIISRLMAGGFSALMAKEAATAIKEGRYQDAAVMGAFSLFGARGAAHPKGISLTERWKSYYESRGVAPAEAAKMGELGAKKGHAPPEHITAEQVKAMERQAAEQAAEPTAKPKAPPPIEPPPTVEAPVAPETPAPVEKTATERGAQARAEQAPPTTKAPAEPIAPPEPAPSAAVERAMAEGVSGQFEFAGEGLTRYAKLMVEQAEAIRKTGTVAEKAKPERRELASDVEAREVEVSGKMIADIKKALIEKELELSNLEALVKEQSRPGSGELSELATQSQLRLLETVRKEFESIAESLKPMAPGASEAMREFQRPVPEAVAARLNKLGLMMKAASKPGWNDMIHEAWINALLSNPSTHIVNTVSNTLTRLSTPVEKGAAGGIDFLRAKFTGTPQERFMGEAAADAYGSYMGLREGLRSAAEAWKTEMPTQGVSKLEVVRPRAIPGKFGRVVRVPGRALVAADEFMKAVIGSAELHSLAFRQAVSEGVTGTARVRRITEIVENPPADIVAKVNEAKLYRTFQQEFGPIGRGAGTLRNSNPAFRYVVPFLRTPINLTKYSLERTPFNFGRLAYERGRGRLKSGELSTELAKPVLGSLLSAYVMMLASEGLITGSGPEDPRERALLYQTGWQPNSAKIGDTYVSYNRIDPFGMILGMTTDFYEAFDEMDEMTQNEMAGRIGLAMTQNVVSKTYTTGPRDFLNAITQPKRYGEKFIENMVGTVVPSVVGGAARATDPFIRDPETIAESIKARIPGLSQTVPPKRGPFGQPIAREGSALARFLSPFRTSKVKAARIERELLRLGVLVSEPDREITIRGEQVRMTAEEYGRLQELKGEIAIPRLLTLMDSPSYAKATDEHRAEKLQSRLLDAARRARRQLLRDPEIAKELRRRIAESAID